VDKALYNCAKKHPYIAAGTTAAIVIPGAKLVADLGYPYHAAAGVTVVGLGTAALCKPDCAKAAGKMAVDGTLSGLEIIKNNPGKSAIVAGTLATSYWAYRKFYADKDENDSDNEKDEQESYNDSDNEQES